jgi:branched-chain amino acid transport system substrate-binding protein
MAGNPQHPSRRQVIEAFGAGAATVFAAPALLTGPVRAAGRTVKIGMVSPQTGPIAAFGEADQWVLGEARKALAGGITIAGEQHPVDIIYRDSQSNPNRASEVAAQLINSDKVDIMVASSTSYTTNPVSDQCELAGVRASPPTIHGRPGSSGETATRRSGSSGPTTSSLASAWPATCSPTCGCRSRPTRPSA